MKKFIVIMVLGLFAANNNAATLTLTHAFGPDTAAFQADFVEKLAAGTVPTGTPVSATDARRIETLLPEHIMLKSNGQGYTWLGIVLSAGAGETVSITDIFNVALRSIESGDTNINRLGKTVSFVAKSYSALSPGIRADGTRVTTGTERVNGKVILVVGFKSFPVSTATETTDVANWFYANDVSLLSTVSATGATTTKLGLSQVGLPALTAVISPNNTFQVFAIANGDPNSYDVQIAPNATGPWAFVKNADGSNATLKGGSTGLDFGPVSNYPRRFVRLVK